MSDEPRFGTGDRVALTGTVRWGSSTGFVTITLDSGPEVVVWGADLVPEAKETER